MPPAATVDTRNRRAAEELAAISDRLRRLRQDAERLMCDVGIVATDLDRAIGRLQGTAR